MGTAVTIVLSSPIRSSSVTTPALMVVGFLLLLYPLAWIILLHNYKREDNENLNEDGMIHFLAYWILDVVPLVANGGMSIFLAAFFFHVGTWKWQQKLR